MEESFSVLRALPHGRQTARDRVSRWQCGL